MHQISANNFCIENQEFYAALIGLVNFSWNAEKSITMDFTEFQENSLILFIRSQQIIFIWETRRYIILLLSIGKSFLECGEIYHNQNGFRHIPRNVLIRYTRSVSKFNTSNLNQSKKAGIILTNCWQIVISRWPPYEIFTFLYHWPMNHLPTNAQQWSNCPDILEIRGVSVFNIFQSFFNAFHKLALMGQQSVLLRTAFFSINNKLYIINITF